MYDLRLGEVYVVPRVLGLFEIKMPRHQELQEFSHCPNRAPKAWGQVRPAFDMAADDRFKGFGHVSADPEYIVGGCRYGKRAPVVFVGIERQLRHGCDRIV